MLLVTPLTSAFFAKSHEYWTIKGFEEINSPITQLCSGDIDLVAAGNFQTDASVLHYFDDKFMSYISTHTRGSGYQACLQQAGTDPELRCYCYGVGLHNVQDHFAHTEVGVVPKYLNKYFSSNLVGHMVIEKSFEEKHMDFVSTDSVVTSGDLDYYDSIICDNLFVETGGDYKYINLLNDMSGIDMSNDVNIFCNGYQGKGFFDTVYNEKLKLPWWFWGLSIGLILVGLAVAILFIIYGRTMWKYSLVFMYLMIALVGVLILVSFFTNNTWQWIDYTISLVPITVTDGDISYYDNVVQQATNQFLSTGKLVYDDNSGRSYVDRNGMDVVGALGEAEKSFQFIILPILIGLFVALNAFLVYKTFRSDSFKKAIKRSVNK